MKTWVTIHISRIPDDDQHAAWNLVRRLLGYKQWHKK